MLEESNPVKEYLFEHIKNSQIIPELLSEKKFDKIIEEIIKSCYDKILHMGSQEEVVGVLATGILHYLLTNSLISSQRKIEYKEMEIDIVIPDLKTLEKDPKKTLLICIPKSSDKKVIEDKISHLEKIQPEKNNIWVILSKSIPIKQRNFVLSKENKSFTKIIFEIAKFTNVGDTSKFKILRI